MTSSPDSPLDLLILGGTTEATELAARLAAAHPEVKALVSLAGRTAEPRPLALPMRVGGFGGAEGLAAFLRAACVKVLVDTTHPFAAVMPFNAANACKAAGIPRLKLIRPAWTPEPGDNWHEVSDMASAAAALGERPRRVFLTIGRQEIGAFAAVPQHHYLARMIEAPEPGHGLPHLTVIRARGPFDLAAETALMREHAIDTVVAKNAGGAASAAKLAAARALALPVVMVARPARPEGPAVAETQAALDWLVAHGLVPTLRGV